MKKVDATVMRSTRYIALVVLVGSLLMQAVFLVLGRWDVTVLLGNLLGAATAILNFFLMAQMVAKALDAGDADNARKRTQLSRTLRMLMMLASCALGYVAPCFHPIAVVIPLLFPSIGAKLSGALLKDE
ncbi:MAG: ATP synthase subunit I [Aristaeellaceae bacterium]